MEFTQPSREPSDLDDHPLSRYRYRTLRTVNRDTPGILVNIPQKGRPDFVIHTRLVKLHPGRPQDPLVVVELSDEGLGEIVKAPRQKPLTLKELRARLPAGWNAHRTTENRTLFTRGETSTWSPPDPDMPSWQYEDAPESVKFEPRYDAISYAWGSSKRNKSILAIDSASQAGPSVTGGYFRMSVTESLYEALQNLRYAREPRFIWADAICINQEDNSEKAQHVQHMGDIYRLANRVIVWLGPMTASSSLALSVLEYLGNQVEYSQDLHRAFDAPGSTEKGWGSATCRLPYDTATWQAIEELLSRPWFDRLWIVQELQLSSREPGALMQCGSDTVTAASLCRAVVCLYMKTGTLPASLVPLVTRAYDIIRPKSDLIMHRVVEQICFNQRCRDPRDKLYGILSLLPERFGSTMIPDYRETCPAAQVYTHAVADHAQHVGRFELWGHLSAVRAMASLPSWVPDWSTPSPVRRQLMPELAAGTSRCHVRYDREKQHEMAALGMRCAIIERITETLPKTPTHVEGVERVRRWQPQDLDTATYQPTGEPLRRAYARTLISGEVEELWSGRPLKLSIAAWERQDYADALFGERAGRDQAYLPTESSAMSQEVQRALEFCRGRAFFETSGQRYFGIAANGVAKGDIVAVFLGCNKPVILRPGTNDTFQFLGEAHIPGMEGARAFLGDLPSPWKLVLLGYGPGGRERHGYLNEDTQTMSLEDPRLEPSTEWERIERDFDGDDPENYDFFRHQTTGETINYDPRLDPEALGRRGVALTWFNMI